MFRLGRAAVLGLLCLCSLAAGHETPILWEQVSLDQILKPMDANGKQLDKRLEWRHTSCRRPNLIIAAVGDAPEHTLTWLEGYDDSSSFDVVALYVGRNVSWVCPECVAVLHARGSKWQLLRLLTETPVWPRLVARYTRVMLADADVSASARDANVAFAVASKRKLTLSQLSLCPHPVRYPSWALLVQVPRGELHYTAFVEIVAPVVTMPFMQTVVLPNLAEASVGWGLDLIWPKCLGYPRKAVAVIDAACMRLRPITGDDPELRWPHHPRGWTPNEEMNFITALHGINDTSWRDFGLPDIPGRVVFGSVLLPKQKKKYKPPNVDYCYPKEVNAGSPPPRKLAPGGNVTALSLVTPSSNSTWLTLLFAQAAAALFVAWLRYRHTHRAGMPPSKARVLST